MQGVCEKVAEAFQRAHGLRVDAATQITICCGQSEAMAAAVFAGKVDGATCARIGADEDHLPWFFLQIS